jgi:ceramide glucosyltransferase
MTRLLVMNFTLWLGDCGCAIAAVAMIYTIVACVAVRSRHRKHFVSVPSQPPVTVLKPLCGAEYELYEALRSFCEQRYSRFQIVFGVRDAEDPAVAIVHRLQREYPGLDLQLAIDPTQRGSSRKVSNLMNMMPLARYDYLVIADSDVHVAPDYLANIVAPLLDPQIGIVTCPYRGRPRPGVWSLLGSIFVNEWFMPSAHVAALFGSRCFAFGATIALRREVLAAIGGFAAVKNQLADDYRLGELTRRMGLRTVLSDVVVETGVDERSFTDLVRHELRWLRTIRTVQPAGYAFSFISFSIPTAALGCLLAAGTDATLPMLATAAAARLMLHFAVCKTPLPPWRIGAVLANDILGFALWCWGFTARRVQWRHVSYRVARDGSAHPVP